ncbi:hypothetical protein [Marinobacterium aestuariivivens]|uniref:Uncharacterized protein n=1 Tax=Marinobacterium aestuariivivens TaxID=1698799 RepID=A0ABW2A9B6_9GAMM
MLKKPLSTKLVSESVLEALVDSGAIHTVYIVEDNAGDFHVVTRADSYEYQIQKKRGGLRSFRDLRRAAELVRVMGVSRIRLHLNEHKPTVRSVTA